MTMSDLQRYLIKNMEDVVVFLVLKAFEFAISCSFFYGINVQIIFVVKPQLNIISFKNYIY